MLSYSPMRIGADQPPPSSLMRTNPADRSHSTADGRKTGPAQMLSLLITGSRANAVILSEGSPRSMA